MTVKKNIPLLLFVTLCYVNCFEADEIDTVSDEKVEKLLKQPAQAQKEVCRKVKMLCGGKKEYQKDFILIREFKIWSIAYLKAILRHIKRKKDKYGPAAKSLIAFLEQLIAVLKKMDEVQVCQGAKKACKKKGRTRKIYLPRTG